jgi:hypothetical protein
MIMKSFLVGLGVGVGLGVLLAPDRAENTRLHGITADAQRKAQDLAQRVRDGLDNESDLDSDDLTCELPPRKQQPRETLQGPMSSTEGSNVVNTQASDRLI